MELFLRMTEIVDLLFSEGETETFTCNKEDLEKSAAMWLPKEDPRGVTAPSRAGNDERVWGLGFRVDPKSRAGRGGDDDDDMFGEGQAAEEKRSADEPVPIEGTVGQPLMSDREGQAGDPKEALGEDPSADYSSWPVKEIARFLKENAVDATVIVEKGELVSLALETEARLRREAREALGSTSTPNNPPPHGFVLDPTSGFYHNAASQMYFDGESGAFWDGSQWLSHDGKSYVPL